MLKMICFHQSLNELVRTKEEDNVFSICTSRPEDSLSSKRNPCIQPIPLPKANQCNQSIPLLPPINSINAVKLIYTIRKSIQSFKVVNFY